MDDAAVEGFERHRIGRIEDRLSGIRRLCEIDVAAELAGAHRDVGRDELDVAVAASVGRNAAEAAFTLAAADGDRLVSVPDTRDRRVAAGGNVDGLRQRSAVFVVTADGRIQGRADAGIDVDVLARDRGRIEHAQIRARVERQIATCEELAFAGLLDARGIRARDFGHVQVRRGRDRQIVGRADLSCEIGLAAGGDRDVAATQGLTLEVRSEERNGLGRLDRARDELRLGDRLRRPDGLILEDDDRHLALHGLVDRAEVEDRLCGRLDRVAQLDALVVDIAIERRPVVAIVGVGLVDRAARGLGDEEVLLLGHDFADVARTVAAETGQNDGRRIGIERAGGRNELCGAEDGARRASARHAIPSKNRTGRLGDPVGLVGEGEGGPHDLVGIADVVEALARAGDVGHGPDTGAVVEISVRRRRATEGRHPEEAAARAAAGRVPDRPGLVVEDDRVLAERSDVFTRNEMRVGRSRRLRLGEEHGAARVVRIRVLEACFALEDDVVDAFLRAFGHADELVLPVRHVDEVDLLVAEIRRFQPFRRDHLPRRHAVLGAHDGDLVRMGHTVLGGADHRVVQRQITEMVEDGPLARLVELRERLVVRAIRTPGRAVSGVALRNVGCGDRPARELLVAGVGPVDLAVVVVDTLDERLEELLPCGCVRVVVADLRQLHVVLVDLIADLDLATVDLLGHDRGLVGDDRHLRGTDRDFLEAHHDVDRFRHGLRDRHEHRAVTVEIRRRCEDDITRRGQREIAVGLDHALIDDADRACGEVDVADRVDRARDLEQVRCLDDDRRRTRAVVDRVLVLIALAGLEDAVHVNAGRDERERLARLDDGVVLEERGDHAADRHGLTRRHRGRGTDLEAEHVRLQRHVDRVGDDVHAVARVDGAEGIDDEIALVHRDVDAGGERLLGRIREHLADHAFHVHGAVGDDGDRTTEFRVDGAAFALTADDHGFDNEAFAGGIRAREDVDNVGAAHQTVDPERACRTDVERAGAISGVLRRRRVGIGRGVLEQGLRRAVEGLDETVDADVAVAAEGDEGIVRRRQRAVAAGVGANGCRLADAQADDVAAGRGAQAHLSRGLHDGARGSEREVEAAVGLLLGYERESTDDHARVGTHIDDAARTGPGEAR